MNVRNVCQYVSGMYCTDKLLSEIDYLPLYRLNKRTSDNIEKLEYILDKKLYAYRYKVYGYTNLFSVLSESDNKMFVFHRYNLGIGRTLFKLILKRENRLVKTLVSIDIGKLNSDKFFALNRLKNFHSSDCLVNDFKNIILYW